MGDRRTKAQASTEFLLIAGLATLILIPATYFFFSSSTEWQVRSRINEIEKIGSDVVNTAETVYYYSDPSKMELTEIMPEGVKEIGIVKDWGNNVNLFVINYSIKGKIQPIVFKANVNINGSFEVRDVSPGKKVIVIEAKKEGDYIYSNIDFK